jgi:hypothetical protein
MAGVNTVGGNRREPIDAKVSRRNPKLPSAMITVLDDTIDPVGASKGRQSERDVAGLEAGANVVGANRY